MENNVLLLLACEQNGTQEYVITPFPAPFVIICFSAPHPFPFFFFGI